MKLRPVVLVLLLLTGFYYVTTHGMATGRMLPALRGVSPLLQQTSLHDGQTGGPFDLREAAAAPAFDEEEQQNIAVYRKALPSVVNITSTAVAFNFFNRPVPQQGQGSGFMLDKQGHILTNHHVIDNAQRVEVTLGRQAQVQGQRRRHRQGTRPRAAADHTRPTLCPPRSRNPTASSSASASTPSAIPSASAAR